MKNWLTILFIICTLPGYTLTLSSDSKISILTCSPGSELYSLFGHSAIHVNDPAANVDIVFNYGTFDFHTQNFYIKYAQGLLPYQLSITSYNNFIESYKFDNRTVWSQTLQLDSLQKQKLFDLLVENYQPANRTYLYNFLFDNCSTRVRDIIAKSIAIPIKWNTQNAGKSFWNLLDEYLYAMPWIQWGIHTILGQPGSQTATSDQYMFLPDYLMYALDSATIEGEKLVDGTLTVYQAPAPEIHNPWYFTPAFVFSIAFLLLIATIQYSKRSVILNSFSILLYLISGLIGVLLIFLGFFTEHPITAPNLNLIWANPLNLIALFFLGMPKLPKVVNYYITFYSIVLAIGIPVWFFATPAVPMASIVLIIAMLYVNLKLKQRKFR